MQVNLSLLQTDFRTNHVSVMPRSEIKMDGQYMRPFSVLRYSDGNTFKYPYSEQLSRHRRSADDFFDDNSNVAMYIVAPLLFLVFGSCCGIYGCYKCREYISENNSVTNVRKKISSFKNFITGKKEKSPKDKFLEQLNERDRPSTAQSLKNSGNMYVIENHEELRSVMSTPGISYFPDNQLYGKLSSFGSTLDYSQSSPLSNGTDSTIISCAVSIESHPFEIISHEPKEKENVEAKFSSHATGKAVYLKQRDMHCGKSPDSPKNKQVVFLAPIGGQAVSDIKHVLCCSMKILLGEDRTESSSKIFFRIIII